MNQREVVLENKTCKILEEFEIQTDHLIPDRTSALVMINKKNKLVISQTVSFWRIIQWN